MPVYEYQCEKCKEVVEVLQKVSDEPLTECEKCGGWGEVEDDEEHGIEDEE